MSSVWVSEADCIGMFGQEDGRKFIDNFCGTTFLIPQKIIAENSVCKVMGMEHMATLCREYGGMPYNRCRNGEGNQQKRADYFFIRERIDEYGNRQGGEGKRSLCAAYRIPHPVIPTPMTL